MAKRLLDLTIAAALLVLALPVLLLLAAVIRLDSPGPPLYRARRVGRCGRCFRMLKLRTMVVDADRVGPGLTSKGDQRITRVGRLLRAARLDELPQLLNVLRGEMSLVGPRPESPAYVDLADPRWQEVLGVRPGVCGLTQLAFAYDEAELLAGAEDVDRAYVDLVLPAKLAKDLEYVRHHSVRRDLVLMLRTIQLVARRVHASGSLEGQQAIATRR